MKRLTDLQHDVKNVQDNVLGDLDADDRVRMFLKAAAGDQDDRIEMLRDSAPRYEYETRDLEFTHGAIEAFSLSSMANAELERLYTAMMMYETARNMHVAVVLLNEALEQLSQGHFTVDEYGNADTPASWPHDYGPQYDPDESRLAGKYRELWEQNDLELAFDTEDRSRPFFAALAADGLLSYRTEVTENFQPAAMARAENHLMETVVEFYRAFHTYRRLAEEHLDMTLDEFLGASQTERLPFDDRTGPRRLTEEKCRDVLERMQQYIDAYEESQRKVGEVLAEGPPEGFDGLEDIPVAETGELMQQYDLDDMVEADVAELAEELEDTAGF
ncbi:hypothetical protein SAMN05216564_1234 [Halopenitus persicus]|uniref:Uncharacterized protein n=2 Tax=Halopenitus persicus TaxID=1048396 RepID=A0A1H3PAN8_9EURY|nr:hypothetical protein SAMN05216564_1234 [Halopenitus persicus]